MLSSDDYQRYDGTGLADLVRRGEVSPAELLECALARAAALNPKLNAIVIPMTQIARTRAQQPLQGPFAGVPFLLKDIYQEYAGVPATEGCRALRGLNAEHHAEITQRWLDAGLVIFGRTNTPEFGAKGITEPDSWGPCRNPWNLAHTPGGSSGGSAAAVAAGIVPMAGGNDGGGSIRLPAGHCGLFGLKPTRGRTPLGPRYAERMHGAVIDHVLTRSVRDSAAMLDVEQGAAIGALYRIAPPARPYAEEVRREPGRLRIAFTTRSPIGTAVDLEAVTAVQNAARLLESLGHHVEEAEPVLDGAQLARDFITMWFATCAATVADVRRRTGCGNEGFELETRAMEALGRHVRADAYVEAYMRWNDYARQLDEFHQRYQIFMTPTMARPPARIGEVRMPAWRRIALRAVLGLHASGLLLKTGIIEQTVEENLQWVPFTQLANLTGVPAMSVPLHWTANGLPLGVQFGAALNDEATLLRLAAQLEQAQPWAYRRPTL